MPNTLPLVFADLGLLPLQRRDFALEGLWRPSRLEGSPTVRRSVITGSVALSLINNGTIVTHQVDPPPIRLIPPQ